MARGNVSFSEVVDVVENTLVAEAGLERARFFFGKRTPFPSGWCKIWCRAGRSTFGHRSLAQRLINAGVSAETLMIIMRHQNFATTEKFYAASRAAQSAAAEIHQQLGSDVDLNAFVGGIIKARRQLNGGPFP
jgi:hypothetical protein